MQFTARVEGDRFITDDPLPAYVHLDGPTLTIDVSPLAVVERYVHVGDGRVRMGTSFDEFARMLEADGVPVAASPAGISQVLTLGIYATPQSAIHGVRRMTSSDVLTVTISGGHLDERATVDDRWNPRNSRNDGEASTDRLRALIAQAVDDGVRSVGGDAALMLSSGKDSVSLAIGLADAGRLDVPCFTFASSDADDEHTYAADLCKRLGLEHHVVTPEHGDVRAAFMRFFEHSGEPTADESVGATMLIAQAAGFDHGGMMDGTGSDPYMGWMPTGRQALKARMRVRSQHLSRFIRRSVHIESGVNYFTRGPLGSLIMLRMFRPEDLVRFYPDAVDTDDVWWSRSAEYRGDPIVFGSEIKRNQSDGRTVHKTRRTADAAGRVGLLPFRDDRLADYYLHLPEPDRIDRSSGMNKVLLRRMLAESIGYDEAVVGANWFQFDVKRFLVEHRDWVFDEIVGCELWSPEIEPLAREWMEQLPNRKRLHHAVHGLFIVSGWHNHSRHLSR